MIPPLLTQQLKQRATELMPDMIQWRRHLHQHPEISYKEFETTKWLTTRLEEMGFEVHHPTETGCVAVIRGKAPQSRVVALRADIDALAMEETGVAKADFRSKNPGAAHCCGHDAHTANLLGCARMLSDLRDQLEGTVVLVFQPGEEKLPGGGRLISESGILHTLGVQAIYGLHTSPAHAPGQIGVIKGPMMARPDEFALDLIGKGGHAAAPHLAIDPIVMAAQFVSAVQTVRSRSINPLEPVVVTVGKINGGTAHNVIPEKVSMLGTIRSFSRETSNFIAQRIEAIAAGIAQGAGGSYSFKYDEGYPAVINTDWATDVIVDVAETLHGPDTALWMPEPVMGGEDFAFYLEHFPGAFFLLGTGSAKADSLWSWHHPRYNIDEDAFVTGASMMAGIALHAGATGGNHG
ncbi:amidohydrolase [Cyclonatronum proteinivorum]|uniref:Amidohydrolase n=1 Tax=Cyclonatronum proteinivorum TaxID=1457365 RepID=A0A345UJV4_9BACT|nr:M20 family metallopeptidase [Cyclonatronum proteinivorum]AXJ00756.1 amidohydrolase [Cyclonatronum proteinivorum]